ncbi:MAG: hypothetical protein KAJ10_03680 [Thermodesulfovibrionia bacterium]|nr:hypothetical protein [Thermodesulfovibrionia bacterium]
MSNRIKKRKIIDIRESVLLPAFLNLLKSHAVFTNREYRLDPSYNNESMGYKEEEAAIAVIEKFTGKSVFHLIKR